MTLPCRVIKVGGSLFDLADLPRRFSAWLADQSPAADVLVAGGGKYCDLIRAADQTFALGSVPAHWLAVRAMHATSGLLAELLHCPEAGEFQRLAHWRHKPLGDRVIVFDVSKFLLDEEPSLPGRVLTHGWHISSDTIAARVAELLAAEELVLLKSADPSSTSLEQLAAAGYVDEDFPQAAAACRKIRLVNLRSPG
jgi:5-(aminomethyl)-3-furanmethanol phosphate kinase